MANSRVCLFEQECLQSVLEDTSCHPCIPHFHGQTVPRLRSSDRECLRADTSSDTWYIKRARCSGSQAPTPRYISHRSEHVLDVRRCNARDCWMHHNTQFVCYALFDRQPVQFFQCVRYTVVGPEIRHITCCCVDQSLKWFESRRWQPGKHCVTVVDPR